MRQNIPSAQDDVEATMAVLREDLLTTPKELSTSEVELEDMRRVMRADREAWVQEKAAAIAIVQAEMQSLLENAGKEAEKKYRQELARAWKQVLLSLSSCVL